MVAQNISILIWLFQYDHKYVFLFTAKVTKTVSTVKSRSDPRRAAMTNSQKGGGLCCKDKPVPKLVSNRGAYKQDICVESIWYLTTRLAIRN